MDSAGPVKSERDEQRIAEVIADIRSRRAAGETIADDAVIAAHPELTGQLPAELRKLEMIQRARRLAGAAAGSLGGGSGASASPARLDSDSIPGYEIVQEIHRGSQGVVYLAIQKSTRRQVAIKVMRHGPFADQYDRMRFEREVQVLSALKHPNIVSIHDSGQTAGLTWFVMNYVEGEPLDAYVSRTTPSMDAVLRLFVKICDAVNAAQVSGVIHRDLKPGNIRIDGSGEPHVLDFGLAKIDPSTAAAAVQDAGVAGKSSVGLARHASDTFTHTGQFVGSLPWASPEQAEGLAGKVDLRTDVYSLGVILFQVLTGLFPYPVSGSIGGVLENIQSTPPIRPSSIRREVNDEVETIVLKCLQKERERRYDSAGELSRDIQRYLRGEPIDAKRDSRLYVLRKQLRRYRLPVAAVLAVFAALVAGIIGTTRATWRAQRAEADAQARALTESRLREQADWEAYKACLAAADAALSANNTAAAKARLDAAPMALRGWEWRYLSSRLDQSLASYEMPVLISARFVPSPDGRAAFVALRDGRLLLLDPSSGQQRELARFDPHAASLALSRDGKLIALGLMSGEISLLHASDGRETRRFRAHESGPVSALAFSADGSLLASAGSAAGSTDSIRIWDPQSGEERAVLPRPNAWVNTLAFRPDGRVLASGHTKNSAGFRLWDVGERRELTAVDYEGLDVYQLEFSPDGARLAVASQDPSIRIYDGTGRELTALTGHAAGISHVAFNSDGSRLASASADQTVRVWDLSSGRSEICRRGHMNLVNQVAFIADDRLLSMSYAESTLKVWDMAAAAEPPTFDTGKYFVLWVGFTADGTQVLTHQRRWDSATGRPVSRLSPRSGWEANAWIGPDASLEWVTNSGGQPASALLRGGTPLLRTNDLLVFRLMPSPDGRRFALALQRGVIQVLRAEDGGVISEIPIDSKQVSGARFSHDGDSLVIWTRKGAWTIWSVTTGREKLSGAHGSQELVNADFSHDDRLLATASYDGTARVWDADNGRELHVLRPSDAPAGDQSVVWSVAFSPDGSRLATGSKDRRIRLWDVATGQEVMALTRHAGTVMCLAWSPDGTQLASGGFDGTVCLWDSKPRAERLGAKARP